MSEAGQSDLAVKSPEPGSADPVHDEAFPARSRLPVTAHWWTAVLVATGASLMVSVSLAEMSAEIGNVSIWIWIGAALIGALQCLLIAELTSRFPGRAGGTAQYAYRVTRDGSPTLGALSSWSYWFAWTPGIAVNLIMAATYLTDLFWPGANVIVVALGIAVVLYFVTALGLRLSTIVNSALAVVALSVVIIIAVTPFLHPESFDLGRVFPTSMPQEAPQSGWGMASTVLKWAFIATWAAYAAEMASTIAAEIRQPERHMKKVMSISSLIGIAAFTFLPLSLFGVVGVEGLQRDPFAVFAEVGGITLGRSGELIVGLGLTAVLILGAEIFIIGSSRTIYQMAQDGHLPRIFGRVNKRGAPVGSIVGDATVIMIMLIVFGTEVVSVVAAATFGYLTVFVLMPLAYLGLRRHPGGHPDAFRLGKPFVVVAVVLSLINATLWLLGGWQWGADVIAVGLSCVLAIIPISYFTRRFQTGKAKITT